MKNCERCGKRFDGDGEFCSSDCAEDKRKFTEWWRS